MLRQRIVLFGLVLLFVAGLPQLCAAESQPSEQAHRNLRQFSRKLFPYHDRKAWGYMDREGKTVLAPAYESPGDFFDDHAVIRDTKNKTVRKYMER